MCICIYIYIICIYRYIQRIYVCVCYTQWNTTPARKMTELLPLAPAWMDLESITLNEISQIEKAK